MFSNVQVKQKYTYIKKTLMHCQIREFKCIIRICGFGNMQDASKAVQIVIPYGPCWIIKIQIMFSKLPFKTNNCGKYRPNTNGMYVDLFQIDEILKKQVMCSHYSKLKIKSQ